jgi:glucose-6-phosphate-specific signal transduction histidine kinase
VEDNGRGFEAGATTAVIGLKTLRDHVALLNGPVYLEAAPKEKPSAGALAAAYSPASVTPYPLVLN